MKCLLQQAFHFSKHHTSFLHVPGLAIPSECDGEKLEKNYSSALRKVTPKERDVPEIDSHSNKTCSFQNASLLGHYLRHRTMHPSTF
jgi:hypothetical protein